MTPVRLTLQSSYHTFAEVMADQGEFIAYGGLSAYRRTPHEYSVSFGRLPRAYWDEADEAEYIIWSAQTPIAWYSHRSGWAAPYVPYSPTTTAHQTRITNAIRFLTSKEVT